MNKWMQRVCALAFLGCCAYSKAAIIQISATDVPPGAISYLSPGLGDMGGFPTPYSPGSLINPQTGFTPFDDIRLASRVNLAALNKNTDNGSSEDGWNDSLFEWFVLFYFFDTDTDTWRDQVYWYAYVDWTQVEAWQTDSQFSGLDFWTGDVRPYLKANQWFAGSWVAVSSFEGNSNTVTRTFFNVASTNANPVNAPGSLLLFTLALAALVYRRRIAQAN